jgi:DNA/RNA-binding domain of Phe-tRNA-synthetase-like protein
MHDRFILPTPSSVFQVAPECLDLGLRAGVILFRDIQVGARPAGLQQEIVRAIAAMRARFSDLKSAQATPELAAFRQVLERVGVNPRKVQHSVEKLLSSAFKRGDLPVINSFVDAYNLLSLTSLCSLGAHDVDRLELPVRLGILTGAEAFTPLGKSEPEQVRPGEFGYVDAANRLLCRLDVLQADFSKVTPATRNALLIIEATASHSPEVLADTFTAAQRSIVQYCGGSRSPSGRG